MAREFTQKLVERSALVKEVSAARAAKDILNTCVLLGVVRQLERGFLPGREVAPARHDVYIF